MSTFTASLPNPEFPQGNGTPSRSLQQDSSGNLYCVLLSLFPSAAGNLEIWKSTDAGHNWTRIVDDTDRGSNNGMDCCMIADVLHIAIVNASIAPNSRLGMYRYNTTTDTFLTNDYGGPVDSGQQWISIVPMSNGSVSICYKSGDNTPSGIYGNAKVTNWAAGVWSASVNFANDAIADLRPQFSIKEVLTERVHYFFGDNGNHTTIPAGQIWHASIEADGTTVNTLQQLGLAINHPLTTGGVVNGDIGNPSIFGADLHIELPYVYGPASGGLDNQESLRALRAVPVADPAWADEEVVAAAAIADGNIEPFLGFGWFNCGSVTTATTIILYFTFTDNDAVAADVRGWLYSTSTTALSGGWTAPSLLFTPTPVTAALANPYPKLLANGTVGIIIGSFDAVTFSAYDSLGLTFIGEDAPSAFVSTDEDTFYFKREWIEKPDDPFPFSAFLASSLSISCNNPCEAVLGVPYHHTFLASLGVPPYTYSISAGTLPTGFTLVASTGIASGTPIVAGSSEFTVLVTDALLNTASVACSIDVTDHVCPWNFCGDSWSASASCAMNGTVGLRRVADGVNGSSEVFSANPITVSAGQIYFVEFFLRGSGGADGTISVGFDFYNAAGTYISSLFVNSTGSPVAFTSFTGTVTVPAEAVTAVPVIKATNHLTGVWCIAALFAILTDQFFILSSIRHYFDEYTAYR